MAELLDGATRNYIVNPQKLRRTDDHKVTPWSRPRIHAKSESEKRKILVMLAKQKVCKPALEDELWEFNGEKVDSGLCEVLKPKKKKVTRPDGSLGIQQRCIINLIPPNALHRDVELGENDLLPAEGQWNTFHLLPLQMILLSARDRRCFSYVFKMPRGWAGIFALRSWFEWREMASTARV